jgi:endonuclease G
MHLLEGDMIGPDQRYQDRLLEILLSLPAFGKSDNRDFLLRRLPAGPVGAISRSNSPSADLNNIIEAAAGMGQLTGSGEWALAIVTRNALQLSQGSEPGKALEALLGELETQLTRTPLPPIPEIVIGPDTRLPVNFLAQGLVASKAVAKVFVPRVIRGVRQRDAGSGTGWLIAPGLLLTNYHVIEAREPAEPPATDADFKMQATFARAWFDFNHDNASYWQFACTTLVHCHKFLDYALLRLAPDSLNPTGRALLEWGHLPVPRHRPSMAKGHRLNIIQHPLGGPKRIAIRSNFYYGSLSTDTQPERIRYLTDTEPGASGSPVFNDDWQVVALHHAAVEVPESQYKGEVIKYNNQGILITAILDNLPSQVRDEIHAAQG